MTNAQDILTGKKGIKRVPPFADGIILGQNRKGFFSVVAPTKRSTNFIENPSFMAGEFPYDRLGVTSRRDTLHGYTEINSVGTRATSHTPESYPMQGGWVYLLPNSEKDSGIYYSLDLEPDIYTFSNFVAGSKAHKYSVYVTREDKLLYCPFDGNTNGHKGQTATEVGGIVYRSGKFGSAVQIAEATINKVLNPMGGGSESITELGGATVTTESEDKSYTWQTSTLLETLAAANDGIAYTLDALSNAIHYVTIRIDVAWTTQEWSLDGTTWSVPTLLSSDDSGWYVYGLQFPAAQANGSTTLSIRQSDAIERAVYIGHVQIEEKSYTTPPCHGDMGTDHAWTGTPHNSTSTRDAVVLSYTASGNLDLTAGSIRKIWIPSFANTTAQTSPYLFSEGNLKAYYLATDDKIYFTDGTNTISTAAQTFSAFDKIDLVFVWSSSGLSIYRDGVLAASGATYTQPTEGADIYIGSDTASANQSNSYHDDFVIFDRALMANEIKSIYESNKPMSELELEVVSSRKSISGNKNWQRLHVTFEAKKSERYNLNFVRDEASINNLDGFYTSFWVCEDNPFLTLPFNGESQEKNTVLAKEQFYEWIGGRKWTSKSVRSEKAVGSGREFFLKDYGFVLSEIIGLGSSGIRHILQEISSGGSVWNTTTVGSREFILKGSIQAETFAERLKNEAMLDSLLNSTSRINIDQPTTLIFRVYNEDNNSIIEGQTLYIYCRFNGGIASDIRNEHGGYDVQLSFTLVDPYLYSSMHRGSYLDDKVTFTSAFSSIVTTKDKDNNWEKAGLNPNGRIRKIIRATSGKLYVGGSFTSMNSVANTKYLIEYDDQNNVVTSVGVFGDNADENYISDIIALADGRIIVAGSFADIDGIPDTHNIAIYDTNQETWFALGSGLPNSDFYVQSMGINQLSKVFITGVESTGGTNYIYTYNIPNSTWGNIGTLDDGVDIPASLVKGQKILVINRNIDPEFVVSDIYITGRFEEVNGVTGTGGLAFYNGETEEWESLGDEIISFEEADLHAENSDNLVTEGGDNIVVEIAGGFVSDLALGQDGKIYMVGNFAQTNAGVLSPYIIRYNGSSFEPVGLPGNYASQSDGIRKILIDETGQIHVLMDFIFTQVQNSIAKDYLMLDGNTWKSGGIYTLSSASFRVVADGEIFWDNRENKIWFSSRPYQGKVTFGGDNNIIKNNGEIIYPKITFTGDGKLISLYNKATNKMIDFSSYNLQNNEIVELDLENYGLEIIKLLSSVNGNITRMISPSSNISFNLVKGVNKLGFIFGDSISNELCFVVWRERYLGLYDAINFDKIIT